MPALYDTSFHINHSVSCFHSAVFTFRSLARQTVITSLNNINWLLFKREHGHFQVLKYWLKKASIVAMWYATIALLLKAPFRITGTLIREILTGFRRQVAENYSLFGYYAASSGNSPPTFRDNLSVPSSRTENLHTNYGLFYVTGNVQRTWAAFLCGYPLLPCIFPTKKKTAQSHAVLLCYTYSGAPAIL